MCAVAGMRLPSKVDPSCAPDARDGDVSRSLDRDRHDSYDREDREVTYLSFAPLEPLLRDCPDVDHAAFRLGVTRRTVERWRKRGLTERSADEAAVALGRHPLNIWGRAWAEAESF